MRTIITTATLLIAIATISSCASQEPQYSVALEKVTSYNVSDRLMGFNIVYAGNPDSIWEDGSVAQAIKDVNPGFLRYPGGTVNTFFHWKTPTGNGWADCWDPSYDHAMDKNPSEYMDIDEYLNLIDQTGATPLLGVNVTSGFVWNRLEDGIQEALDLMKYVKEKGYDVKYWYMGNEPYQFDCNGGAVTPARYGEMINAFVPRMKEIDPDIKIIANWHATFRKHGYQYEDLIRVAGSNIDVIDVHWYCMWGNASWDEWLGKTPCGVFLGDSYESEIYRFREITAQYGYPDIKLASLEWNVGPGKKGSGPRLTPDEAALIQSEMMMQFMHGGLDMATFWPLFWDGEFGFRAFIDKSTGKANPVADIFKIMGQYQGCEVVDIPLQLDSDLLCLGIRNPESGKVSLCLLNKSAAARCIEINNLLSRKKRPSSIDFFQVNTEDRTMSHLNTRTMHKKIVNLPSYSLALINY